MGTLIAWIVIGVIVQQVICGLVFGWHDDTDYGDFTTRERLANIRDIWTDARAGKEVRLTAIGWNPSHNSDTEYQEDKSVACDKPQEFYRVIRRGRNGN